MACYHPQKAWKLAEGGVTFTERGNIVSMIELPCRQCIGCRLARSQEWAVRLEHESRLHQQSCWLTLTYETPPEGNTLVKADLQKFIRRLRKAISPVAIRFFACGEYGERGGRPHYHVCIFGYDFPDKILFKQNSKGPLYTSPLLTKLWGHGHAVSAILNSYTAGYTARYSVKKITGDLANTHYTWLDPETGVLYNRLPEFGLMSTRPGIGAGFFDKFHGDLYPNDYAVHKGAKLRMPAYYDKLQKRKDPELLEELKFKRTTNARKHYLNNTDERLAVREEVHQAKAKTLKRPLK